MYPHHQIPPPQPQVWYLDDQQQSEPESNPWKAVGALVVLIIIFVGFNYISSKVKINTTKVDSTVVVQPMAVQPVVPTPALAKKPSTELWPNASDYLVTTSAPTPKPIVTPKPAITPKTAVPVVPVSTKTVKTVEKAPNKPKMTRLVNIDTILSVLPKTSQKGLKTVKGVYVTFTGQYEAEATAVYIRPKTVAWNYVVDAKRARQMLPEYRQSTSGSAWANSNCLIVALAQNKGIVTSDRDILAAKLCAQLLLKYNLSIDKLYLDPEAITFTATSWTRFKFSVSNYMKLQ
jgi:hypothetical protein